MEPEAVFNFDPAETPPENTAYTATWTRNNTFGDENSCRLKNCSGCLKRASDAIISGISKCFYRLGLFIGLYPWYVIIGCLVFVGIFIPGLALFFKEENNGDNLWVPLNSQALIDKDWVESNFPSTVRPADVIVVNDNILTARSLNALMDVHKNITSPDLPKKWEQACAKRGPTCWASSILEFWSFDEKVIRSLNNEQILDKINTITTSPVFLTTIHIEKFLGAIWRGTNGSIIGAKATRMTYIIKANGTIPRAEDASAIEWEDQFEAVLSAGHHNLENVFRFTFATETSEVRGSAYGDLDLLSAGYIVIFIFVAIVLGRFNCVQQRMYITLAGVLCVGLSILVSFGLCSYIGYFYGPAHNVLPFLLIGIGVDDMFVIIQALDQVSEEEKNAKRPIHEKIALCLKHAGVSVTVTSATDVVAFGIGATTVLPGLRSFCVYASFGILSIFLLQVTFFVASITIDERRALSHRNACCCCYSHPEEWVPNKCSRVLILQTVFSKFYGPWLVKRPVKIIVALLSVILLGFGIWGLSSLRQDSNPTWLLPPEGNGFKYLTARDKYFPETGRYSTAVYLGEFNYFWMSRQLDALHSKILADPYTDVLTVSNWFFSYKQWLRTSTDPAVTSRLSQDRNPLFEDDMITLLKKFLYDPPQTGLRFAASIKFDPTQTRITASQIQLAHINMELSSERVAAMDSLRGVCGQVGFQNDQCFAYSLYYTIFEGDKAIQLELLRNIGFAFLCVFVMMLFLLANLWACVIVSIAVLMALIDVAGIIHYWGLTINVITAVQLIIAVGLIVDYSAHIGHCFMVKTGTRDERTVKTLGYIGPAVMFGGFSTFLAFIMLAGSQSYIFQSFFKVLLSVVFFGLFHGLVLLPVLLSWFGPAPYFSDNYPPSVLGKGIRRIKMSSCRENMPDLAIKYRLQKVRTAVAGFRVSEFRKHFQFGRSKPNGWRNSAVSNTSLRIGSNYNATNGMIANKDTANGRLSHGETYDSTNSINYGLFGNSQNNTQMSVIQLPMSDFLNVQFKMTVDSAETAHPDLPTCQGPTWEHTIKRIPNRIGHQTAWQPSYKGSSGSSSHFFSVSSSLS